MSSADSEYFEKLSAALHDDCVHGPVLILDLDRIDKNIDRLMGHLPADMGFRIVTKSLPIPKLIDHIRSKAGTDKLMSFNIPMLSQLSQDMPKATQFLGKPMPVAAFQAFLRTTNQNRLQRIHWLIDTPERLSAYKEIATNAGVNINISLELDVGLHRGGFTPDETLLSALKLLHEDELLTFTGMMGYEPHLTAVPKILGWQARAIEKTRKIYSESLAIADDVFGTAHRENLIRNIAGSPTFRLYKDTSLGNEVSVGSALVKPIDFDTDLLEDYVPACFIATPVLKTVGDTRLPALEFFSAIKRMLSPKTAQSIFIHGGKWLANPVYPSGMTYNKTFGRSSNQEMLNGPSNLKLKSDDFVFLRPQQSEALFLQFGDVIIIRKGKITDKWATLPVSA